MSKRSTSFLALAALVLLAMPAQAQTFAKQKASDKRLEPTKLVLTTPKALKTAKMKVTDTAEGRTFRKANGTGVNVNAIPLQKKDSAERRAMPQGIPMVVKNLSTRQMPLTPVSRKAARMVGEEVDEHGIITSPAEGEEQVYERSGTAYYSSGSSMYIGTQSGSVNIVECSDGTVYIQDPVSLYTNGTWVKGMKKGNTITVPARQPLYYSSKYNTTVSLRYGLLSADGSISAADDVADVFTFTVEGDVITLQGTQAFDSDNPTDSYYIGAFWDDDDLATGFGDAKSVWTKLSINTQVNELPYANNFDDLGQDLAFTIIDANEDGSTWYFTTSDGNGYAQYQWNDDNAGDDWLVSPAIKLETGKIYHVNIDAWAESDYNPERVEVKLGNAKTAAAMTKDVIPATVVDWNSQDIQTLQSKGITVDADGYYYFGIHAISDANKYYLNVDNFYVDVIAGDAPNAVTDLTVVPIENQVGVNVSFTAPATKINGDALDENISVNILRDGNVIKTIGSPAKTCGLSKDPC